MPNIQIRGSQIQGESVEASNINLSGSFDFRAATGMQFLTKPEAENSTFPATTAFVHTIVTGSLIDGFQGGNGIAIDTSTSPDTIAVDLGTNPGLQFSSNKLVLKAKSETGGTITLDADGIYIEIPFPALNDARLEPNAIPEIVLFASLALAIEPANLAFPIALSPM